MAELDKRYARAGSRPVSDAAIDQGLRSYMLSIYNYMGAAVALTGVVAYVVSMLATTNDPALAVGTLKNGKMLTSLGQTLYGTPLKWVIMLAPLGLVFLLGFRVHKMSLVATQATFWIYAALMGLSLSSIFLVFTGESIVQMFFISAAAFAALSLFGYTTKKDLSAWGSFLFMGVIGLIIAMVVNIFLQSSALAFAISVIGVLVFAGLTAYDTQRLKNDYFELVGQGELMAKAAVMGALSLYLNFINMFMFLLQLLGNRE
ncbi:MAG: Bax inhibitor-1/YccA family protein [Pseudomonadota bacterium]